MQKKVGEIMAKVNKDGKSLANKRTYTEYQVIQAVALYNLYRDYNKVSLELDIPKATIQSWVQDSTNDRNRIVNIEDFSLRTEDARKRLLDSMSFVMTEALQQVHKGIDSASPAQAATIFGILFDKMQIMLGNYANATQNNIYIDMQGMDSTAKADLMRRALNRSDQQQIATNNSDNVD